MKLFNIKEIEITLTTPEYDVGNMFNSEVSTEETYKFLCKRYSILLKNGDIIGAETVAKIIKDYLIIAWEHGKIDLAKIVKI